MLSRPEREADCSRGMVLHDMRGNGQEVHRRQHRSDGDIRTERGERERDGSGHEDGPRQPTDLAMERRRVLAEGGGAG